MIPMSSEQTPLPMYQETTRPCRKTVLDVEAFQRILAAVYTLQQYHDKLSENDAANGDFSRRPVAGNVPPAQSGFSQITEPENRELENGEPKNRKLENGEPENSTYEPAAESEQSYLHHPKQRQSISIISPTPVAMSIFLRRDLPAASRNYPPKIVAGAMTALLVIFAALLMTSIHGSLSSWLTHRYVRQDHPRAASGESVKVASEVAARIHADGRLQLASVQVSASKSGIITLSGEVSSAAERVLAAQHASKVKGVNVVVDNLRVIEPRNATNVATQALTTHVASSRTHNFHVSAPIHTARVLASAETGSATFPDRIRDTSVAPSASLSRKRYPSNANAAGMGSVSTPSTPAVAIRTLKEVIVPYGTILAVQLTEPLSSDLNRPGDSFSARLVSPIMVGNRIAIPAGATVQGRIVEVRNAGHFNGRSELVAKVTRLLYDGRAYNLRSTEYSMKGASRDIQTAEIIGGGAGAGAILGAILGGKKGAAIGAVLGAGAGTGARVMSKPKQIELPAQSTLSFRLETPLKVIPSSAPLGG